ncbi:hypothetical protein SORBI_3002G420500 [Sorghum bicolor]|uniref:Uncharacterized protein n=1 Tax=Sorghum bicolor TaxID=4558 RepID=A0A1W0W7W9_SORBI|nr:hypothetical protein SORBI_3002G420500 [Sorghum bicolor]
MAADADYLDDDEFDDYNPHPYAGGYDITATYGSPLPPSSATCYPVASRAATPAPTAPQPVPRSPLPQPPTSAPAPAPQPPRPSSPPAPAAEPYYWPKPYDYGDAPRHQPLYPTPEVFRGWPFLPPPVAPHCHCRSTCACARARARDYWRHCMRGLDYLFGHCDGYGERRIGVDSLGVPVYANTKGGVEDSVVVEVAPPATGTVQWHDDGEVQFQSNRSSWYGNAEEETHSYEQPTYISYDRSYEQPTYISYDRSYEQPTYTSYDRSYEQPTYTSYDRPYEQPTYTSYDGSYEQHNRFHGVPDETTWFPNQSYQDVYREEESQYQNFGEQPLHIQVEPPETVSSHKLEYYEGDETNHISQCWNFGLYSTYTEYSVL